MKQAAACKEPPAQKNRIESIAQPMPAEQEQPAEQKESIARKEPCGQEENGEPTAQEQEALSEQPSSCPRRPLHPQLDEPLYPLQREE